MQSDRGQDKKPKALDRKIGTRIRDARRLLNLTQQQLAERAGLSFQQVQKYETGVNRISASSLFEFAAILNQPVSYFFSQTPDRTGLDRADGALDMDGVWRAFDQLDRNEAVDLLFRLSEKLADIEAGRRQ